MDTSIGETIARAGTEQQALVALIATGFTEREAQFFIDMHYGRVGGDRLDADGKPLPFLDLEDELKRRYGIDD